MNNFKRLILCLSLFAFGMALHGQKSPVPNPPGKLVDVGGYELHFNIQGSGKETIVIETGTGSWSLQWMKMQRALAKDFRVVTYDRAGYGWSDRSPYSRTANNIVDELSAGLKKAGVTEPFIIMGHSYGGLIAKAYLKKYPNDVKAVIFADAATAYQFEKLPPMISAILQSGMAQFKQTGPMARAGMLKAEMMPVDSTLNRDQWSTYQNSLVRAEYYDAMYNEMDLLPTTYKNMEMTQKLDIPVLVITAGNSFGAFASIPNVPVEESNKIWAKLQKELLTISSNSRQYIIQNASHDLLLTASEDLRKVVVEFVRGLD